MTEPSADVLESTTRSSSSPQRGHFKGFEQSRALYM